MTPFYVLKKIAAAFLQRNGYRAVSRELDPQSLRSWLYTQKIMTIIDVGASEGSTSLEWLQAFPLANVHGIEPLPTSFSKLKKLESSFPGRFFAWNFAAGNEISKKSFQFHSDHPTSSSVLGRTPSSAKALPFTAKQQSIAVEMRTLDSLLESEKVVFKPLTLLKLDVQGYEIPILAGAKKVLEGVDFLLTEITFAPMYTDQTDFGELHVLLTNSNFILMGFLEQFHLESGRPIYADVLYIKKDLYQDIWKC